VAEAQDITTHNIIAKAKVKLIVIYLFMRCTKSKKISLTRQIARILSAPSAKNLLIPLIFAHKIHIKASALICAICGRKNL